MKKLLLPLLTLVAGVATQSYADEQLKAFKIQAIEHHKACKAEWLNHTQSVIDRKFDLLKLHQGEDADLKLNAVKTMPESTDKAAWKAHCLNELAKMLQLKEKQMKDWATLHETINREVEELANKDKEYLAKAKAALTALAAISTAAKPSETVAEFVTSPEATTGDDTEVETVEAVVAAPAKTDTVQVDLK